MRNWLEKYRPSPWLTRKLIMLAALIGVGAAAFCWGRWQSVEATPPTGRNTGLDQFLNGGANSGELGRRVVAYLYGGKMAISREELGEYLIDRFGAERLEALIARKIVEVKARERNIYVTDAEVDDRFRRDLRSFGPTMTEKTFVESILRRFNRSLFEWKEDVIRPKLMMEKIVRPMVTLTEKDLQEGFEARYGPKVQCRMIVMDDSNATARLELHNRVTKGGREQFLKDAATQAIPNLAQLAGQVPPIHKHFGDAMLEDAAFRLKVDEVSALMQMKDKSWVILYCEKHIPADLSVTFDKVRLQLSQEMQELRVAQKIPEVFEQFRKEAAPRPILVPERQQASAGGSGPATLAGESAVKTSSKETAPVQPQPVKDLPKMAPPPQPQPGITPLAAPPMPEKAPMSK
jgi:hypothetical protein